MKIASFKIDVSAEIGHPLCGGGFTNAVQFRDAQYIRGIILDDGSRRVVLCAVDYCEIGGRYHREWCRIIGRAAGTSPSRVVLHSVHQHDAIYLREGMVKAGKKAGIKFLDEKWWKRMSTRIEKGVRKAARNFREVASVGHGQARVERAASNRRIMKNGKVAVVRWSVCEPPARRFPAGLIDPFMKSITFWSARNVLLGSLNYYACHPQCSSGRRIISADAPGEAHRLLEKKYPGAAHVYFTGCAGNITLGKYSSYGPEGNIRVIGRRLASGMKKAIIVSRKNLEKTTRLEWRSLVFSIPFRLRGERAVCACLRDSKASFYDRANAAVIAGVRLDRRLFSRQVASRLSIGRIHIIHLPCEPFVEYQLYAQSLKPGHFVATAGYVDSTVGYLPLAKSFREGGFEVNPSSCYTSPAIEGRLKKTISRVLLK